MKFMSLQIIPELGFATKVNLAFCECNNYKIYAQTTVNKNL